MQINLTFDSSLQDFAEEEQEFQEGVNDTRFRQRVRGPAVVRPAASTAAGIQADAIIACYAECLQQTLKVRHRTVLGRADKGCPAAADTP